MERPLIICFISIFTFLSIINVSAAQKTLDSAIESRLQAQHDIRTSQKRIDSLADQTKSLLDKYRYTIRRSDSLKAYNAQLKKHIKNQKKLLLSIRKQLNNLDETKRTITPLLVRMVKVFEKFIALDIPFLIEERQQRLDSLKKMMDQPEITVPEKYRRIMEAYQIEIEYGRTIETYSDNIKLNATNQTVNILRVGRISLVYQTLDGNQCGVWDINIKTWQALPESYNHSIKQGMQIARKQSPPDLFNMPVRLSENIK